MKYQTMSYKQYYYATNQGMQLRSGTTINCLQTSAFMKDWNEAVSYTTRHCALNGTGQRLNCLSLHSIIIVLEKYAHDITEEPLLFGFYKMALNKLPEFADGLNKGRMVCNCCTIDISCVNYWNNMKYKTLPMPIGQTHDLNETKKRIETLYQHLKKTMHKNERKMIEAMSGRINEDCARHILAYL